LTQYLLSQLEAPDLERSGLKLLQEYHDPWTVRQLEAIGVAEGWRCVDVGRAQGR
jgi:hypothetical protein